MGKTRLYILEAKRLCATLICVALASVNFSAAAQDIDTHPLVYATEMSLDTLTNRAEADSLMEQLELALTIKQALDSLQAHEEAAQKKGNIFKRLGRYFGQSNVPKDKPFDCTFVIGPSYSKTNSFMLGGGLAGTYSYDRSDPELNRSNISAFFSGSVTGIVMLYVKTQNYLKGDRFRWDATLKAQNGRNLFWGIGYDEGLADANETEYRMNRIKFLPNFDFKLANNIFIGPSLDLNWIDVRNDDYNTTLWHSQSDNIFTKGLGLTFTLDSRDVPTNAYKGYYVQLKQMFYPKVANTYYFNKADITLQGYWPMWRNCTLAAQLHGASIYGGKAPWHMLCMVGEMNRMRGYYEGRYRDNNILEGQIELRQRIWKRLGMTVFGGFANTFDHYDNINLRHTLPNYGIGLRCEFKPRINIRLDVGFTKNKPGFVLDMSEAF